MTPFFALIRKDLLLFISDRRAIVISLVVPIVLASFLGYLFGGKRADSEISRMPVLAIDQDGSEISRGLIANLASDKNLDVKPSDLDAARTAVRKGKATAAIVIPKDFGTNAGHALFGSGTKPELGVLYDPSHSAEVGMVKGILSGAVMQTVSKEMFSGKMGRKMMNDSLAQLDHDANIPAADRTALRDMLSSVRKWNEQQQSDSNSGQQSPVAGGLTLPYQTREEAITSGIADEYNGYAHSFAGMGVQFILFMGLDVGIALLLLRQSGLWQRLRAAPLSRTMLLGSRALSAALIAGFILTVLFSFARIAFGVHIRGSVLGFIAVCAAFSLMTATFGLMIAALGETPEATRGYSIMATLIMVMLGGAWAPTFLFPKWMQQLTLIVPTRWAMDGLDAMTWRGLEISSALIPAGILLLFSLLFGTVAVLRFKWRVEG